MMQVIFDHPILNLFSYATEMLCHRRFLFPRLITLVQRNEHTDDVRRTRISLSIDHYVIGH